MKDNIERCKRLGLSLYNIHPGAARDGDKEKAKARIAEGINIVHDKTQNSGVTILLETMTGGGTIIGGDFQEIADIIKLVKDKSRIGVTLDTCHSFTAGYDIRTLDGWNKMIISLDKTIGLQYLRAIHLNDSQHPFASKRDRHQHLGHGYIGTTAFMAILTDEQFKNMPIILETPWYTDDEVREEELNMWNKFCLDRNNDKLKKEHRSLSYLIDKKKKELEKLKEIQAEMRNYKQNRKSRIIATTTNNPGVFLIRREE